MPDSVENDDFQSKSARFIDWLENSGAQISSKIELADLRHGSSGRGVLAKEDIREDEELFSIPRLAILDVTTSSLPDGLQNKLDDPWLSLILAMIREHRLGESSKYKPYFDVLPEALDTLMYWSDKELEYLAGSAVVNKIGKKSADAVFMEKIIPIIRQSPCVFNASDSTDDELLALCHRMGSLIMAYAFDLEGSSAPAEPGEEWEEDSDSGAILPKGMIPLADMLNADADRNNAKLFYEDDGTVSMKTIKAVKKEEELFNDYGPLPRADVLRRYGYVTDNYAQYDVVEISNDLIKEVVRTEFGISANAFDRRMDFLSEYGLEEDSWDIARSSNEDGQFSEEFRIFVNTVITSEPDLDRLKEKDKLPKPDLSKDALKLLHAVLVRRKAMYPSEHANTTEANGSNSANSDDRADRRRKMALAVIEGEKQLIQEALDTINAPINHKDDGKRKADTNQIEVEEQRGTSKKQKR
jgi:SET domain-containing protein 6